MPEEHFREDKDWPHAPVHRLGAEGVYIVTAGTLYKEHFFKTPENLNLLESRLLSLASQYRWLLEAWAVFSNHYHFIVRGQAESASLKKFVTHLYADTARELNRQEEMTGRRVWHNYWDTRLTHEHSYLARLQYVHQNAVKHGLATVANQYRWCSAAWFERTAATATIETVYSFKTDNVKIRDDF